MDGAVLMADIVCATRQREDETMYSACLNHWQVQQLASGFVPASVKSQMYDFLTWLEQDHAKANRPPDRPAPAPRKRSA